MDDRLRASNAHRDRAAALLRAHFVAGRLTHDELYDRLAAALGAVTFGDLRRALADLPGPGPALLHDSRLERGYRRLLALYPARYRRVHEDEMLAVLMTAAADGQDRPGLAEAADLIIGALRVRGQALRGRVPGWRGALAVIGAGTVLGLLAGIPFASANPVYGAIANLRLVAAPSRATYDWVNRHRYEDMPIGRRPEALFLSGQAVASSYPILARAARTLSTGCVLRPHWHHCRPVTEPHMSVRALRRHIHISVLPNHEMVISAEPINRWADSRRTVTAVTASYIDYLSSKGPDGRHPALLYVTSSAPRSRSTDVLQTSGLGALFGALIGIAIGAVALIPRRRRLQMA
jgi:hypothetical protein